MKKESITLLISFSILFLGLFFCPIIIWGQDGLSLWPPIVSEFLRSSEHYVSSPFIFDGQNLDSIYGHLPIWYLFKLFGFNYIQVLNLTFFTWIVLAFIPLKSIFENYQKSLLSPLSIILLLYYLIFSPVILNRLMAGHFNLLFGILPFVYFLSHIYKRTVFSFIISFIAIYFSLSIQSYQIISYYIFYLPILLFLTFESKENNPTKSIIFSLFSLPQGLP